jgi:hypothetical protein
MEAAHAAAKLAIETSAGEVVVAQDNATLYIMDAHVIPLFEKMKTKPPYVCPGCSTHMCSNNMINGCHVR